MVDLCHGPHLPNTGYLKTQAVNNLSRAFWRADVNKDPLQVDHVKCSEHACCCCVHYEANMHLLLCCTGQHRVVGVTCNSSSAESCCQGCCWALCFTFTGEDCSTNAKQDVAAAAASLTSNQTCISHTFNQIELEELAVPHGRT